MMKPLMIEQPGVPATYLQLDRLRKKLPGPLPADFEQFLRTVNGGVPKGASLVIPFLEIQDRITAFRGIRGEDDPFALRPGELGEDVSDPASMLVVADTRLGNPLALYLSQNDFGAVYYILRNPGKLTSGTFAIQRVWRLFENFTELCGEIQRPITRELAPGADPSLGPRADRGDTDHVIGLWSRETK